MKYLKCLKNFMFLLKERQERNKNAFPPNNGGEYCDSFDAFYLEHRIKQQKTPLETPKLNGLVERMNRTLVERVRCLLLNVKLSKSFWGETLRYCFICY